MHSTSSQHSWEKRKATSGVWTYSIVVEKREKKKCFSQLWGSNLHVQSSYLRKKKAARGVRTCNYNSVTWENIKRKATSGVWTYTRYQYVWIVSVKHGSQYDACATIALRASGWRWNRLDFYSSLASWALASIQPIRLSKNLTTEIQFD